MCDLQLRTRRPYLCREFVPWVYQSCRHVELLVIKHKTEPQNSLARDFVGRSMSREERVGAQRPKRVCNNAGGGFGSKPLPPVIPHEVEPKLVRRQLRLMRSGFQPTASNKVVVTLSQEDWPVLDAALGSCLALVDEPRCDPRFVLRTANELHHTSVAPERVRKRRINVLPPVET